MFMGKESSYPIQQLYFEQLELDFRLKDPKPSEGVWGCPLLSKTSLCFDLCSHASSEQGALRRNAHIDVSFSENISPLGESTTLTSWGVLYTYSQLNIDVFEVV